MNLIDFFDSLLLEQWRGLLSWGRIKMTLGPSRCPGCLQLRCPFPEVYAQSLHLPRRVPWQAAWLPHGPSSRQPIQARSPVPEAAAMSLHPLLCSALDDRKKELLLSRLTLSE